MRYFFLYLILSINVISIEIAHADIHLGISEKITQLTGEINADKTQGNLTSFLSPSLGLTILANLNQKLKLLFSAEFTQMQFSAPSGRSLVNEKIYSKTYSTGFQYFLSEDDAFKFQLGFDDYPYYRAKTQTSVELAQSNGIFFNTAFKHVLKETFISAFELSLKAISPIKSEYDQGRLGYGSDLLIEKEYKQDQYNYDLQAFIGFQKILMKTMTFTKEEIGLRLIIKIPLQSKKLI